jgi:thiamine-phosphate pyrophosphorylase
VSRLNKPSPGAVLCYVTDRHSLATTESGDSQKNLLSKIEAAVAAGADWIQIREKDLLGRDCGLLTRKALLCVAKSQAGSAARTRIIVNDRLDVALTEKAGGAHLGEKSLPVTEAKRLVVERGERNDFLIGVSCHSVEAARASARDGADYLFFGPVFATPSKVEFGAPQGLGHLATVCRQVSIPVLAIGGIALENASACFAAGASGIAAIRLFQDTKDISSLVQSLRNLAR